MSQANYLVDESLPLSLVAALRRAEPAVDVWRVGQTNMPAFGCDDPTPLAFCERAERMLVSLDRASMPDHVATHLAANGHTWGVLLVTRRCSFRTMIDDLILIWTASEAEEWRNTLHYLPLSAQV
jgi:hypothetical protein